MSIAHAVSNAMQRDATPDSAIAEFIVAADNGTATINTSTRFYRGIVIGATNKPTSSLIRRIRGSLRREGADGEESVR